MNLHMSKIEKLIQRFLNVPSNLTWEELVKILNYKGYFEKTTKGKIGGSRRKFVNAENDIVSLHKPHPRNIAKK